MHVGPVRYEWKRSYTKLLSALMFIKQYWSVVPCGMMVTEDSLLALKEAGVMACSFSLDGPDAATHDSFRGITGAYASVTSAMGVAKAIGMPFQVNVTVSTLNFE